MNELKIDVVCPLYRAEGVIEKLIASLRAQKGVVYGSVVFPVTEEGDTAFVKEKITAAGYIYFSVKKVEFSHSLTREKAMREYCGSDVVVMLSEDAVLSSSDALFLLARALNEKVFYAYGRQTSTKRTIERYVREKNYPDKSYTVAAEDIGRLQLRAFFASDAFAAYYRPAFLALGGYGEHMMMNEDMLYSKKVLDGGYEKAYCAEAAVEHAHNYALKQLYNRYYETGKWFARHPEFDGYKTTDTGLKLALCVLGKAIKHFNVPVLFRWLPDMSARYLGMKRGRRAKHG